MIGVYFSGTGNSKFCVETFVKAYDNNAKCIAIEDEACVDWIKSEKNIVFGYPTYYSNLPKIVHDFIENNKTLFAHKNIFIICTMGLFSGDGTGCSARLFKQYGATILGGLQVKMPDCIGDEKALKKSLIKNQELVIAAKSILIQSADALKNNQPTQDGLSTIDRLKGLFGQRLWFYGKTRAYTNKIKVDTNKCIGCGKCISLCPLANLELHQGKVISKGKCTMCYRCFAHCPKQAITILGKHVHEQCYLEKYK